MRLQNRIALVTGGAQGIGRAVAARFAAEGAKVVVNDVAEPWRVEQVAAHIRKEGGEALAWPCDVSLESEVNRMVEAVEEHWGSRIDILVNNAGIYPRKPWYDITGEEWDRVMAVNVRSCFHTSKAVYPGMKAQGYGKIINVSSVTFWSGQAGFLHYVTSKGGIIGFTRALAREVGKDGICVNAITPGAVLTEQELIDFPGEDEQRRLAVQMAQLQSFSRREMPVDLVGTFVYLASVDSDFVTGQTINVDGGWMMH